MRGTHHEDSKDFWALRDVTFDVQPGEVVGIVGRNGAGKSTLLKILSRITEPTKGEIILRGRVASLLEVGTGFHPELTGRENIYLNGTILGMRRSEINKKFDEIIAFAEIEKFLDTPVKRYSSGMYVRLAFAVAAHLEPEILIVDEILAVGDIAFQKKCLGKMHDVAESSGRTVLFVSHNFAAVRELCTRAVLLSSGQVEMIGETDAVLRHYALGNELNPTHSTFTPNAFTSPAGRLCEAWLETPEGKSSFRFPIGAPFQVRTIFELEKDLTGVVIALHIALLDGTVLETTWSEPHALSKGRYEAVFVHVQGNLAPATYQLILNLSNEGWGIDQQQAVHIDIVSENAKGYFPMSPGHGSMLNTCKVSIKSAVS